MKLEDLIIYEPQEFENIQRLIKSVFNTNQNLPQQVFSNDYSHFIFEEYDWAIYYEFWGVLQQLATASQDTHIITALLEPNPVTFFFKEFGYYSWFKLPTTLSEKEYGEMMNYGPKAKPDETLLYMSSVVAWVPLSKKWAIWGDRRYEVCILAFADQSIIMPNNSLKGRWRPVKNALDELISLIFRHQQVPQEIADTFIKNYSK